MDDFQSLIKVIKENEAVAKRFHEVEKKILSILNFKDFFEVLLTEIQTTFNMPYVWFTMIEESELANLLKPILYSEILFKRIHMVERSCFTKLVENKSEPILINDNIEPFNKLLPSETRYEKATSIAIVPISVDGHIVGSLNQADTSPFRFTPEMDTSLLEQLGKKLSLCLSNVTAHEKLKTLSYHDPLTKLLNRRVMGTVLQREFNRSKRYAAPLSLVCLDLDNFKRTNTVHGHNIGDSLLQYVAGKLENNCRESDVVVRFTENEFVFILPETSAKQAKKIMNRYKIYFLEHPFKVEDIHKTNAMPVSISFGVASTEDKTIKNATQLLKKADKNLHQTKKTKAQNILQNNGNGNAHKVIDLNGSLQAIEKKHN
jgi:diguanylate cyclase (GGDEF)-like protein